MYSLMNYGDIALGTWYPMGGMYKIIEGMVKLAASKGVKFEYNQPIEGFDIANGKITAARTSDSRFSAGVIVGSADYHYIEQTLLPEAFRQYSPAYWDSRVLSPSALVYYIGINKKLKNLEHHNLFFDQDFEPHADTIYKNPSWPVNPSFYVCCVTATDASQAPEGHENLFVLVPVAPGIEDTSEIREHYYSLLIDRMEHITGEHIKEHVVFKQSYAHKDFERDYNAYKGNAYGLANTLRQTAFLKPSLRSTKISNLFYAGQLTVPGPGVPPALISGQVAGDEIARILGGGMK
jgi:phytoene desaturase